MALRDGQPVPDVTATAHDGSPVRLADLLADGPVVLFFFPRAHTRGCTAETCHFRDLAGEFAELGARPVGVSRDRVTRQASFADSTGVDFPLLADEDGEVARRFGVKRPGPLGSKRHTFVIDADGTLLGTIRSETNMSVHADRALALLRSR